MTVKDPPGCKLAPRGEGHVVIAPVSDCHSTVFHRCIHPDVNHQCLILDQSNLIQSLTII